MKKLFTYLLPLFLMMGLSGYFQTTNAQKSKSAIKKLLEQRDKQIKAVVGPKGTEYSKARRRKLKNIINNIIDYKSMAQYALQDTYDNISDAKKNEFVELFSSIIRDHSLQQLDIYRAHITYRDINVTGNDAVVHTLAIRNDVRKSVVYKLHYKQGSKQWVVTDFIIDDVSTADSYRRQFQNIIRKKGFDSLLNTLRKRANR